MFDRWNKATLFDDVCVHDVDEILIHFAQSAKHIVADQHWYNVDYDDYHTQGQLVHVETPKIVWEINQN